METYVAAAPGRGGAVRVSADEKRVLVATLVGTTIEWYDFFVYAQAAGLVFGPQFFGPMVQNNPLLAQIVSFATIGLSFLFRPLGAVLCGHLGDRLGRRAMFVMTLVLMGVATAAIGVLPTYAQIGAWAPALLILMRVLQGFSAGGEWGGAALMAVEHAPAHRRSFFGSFPQIGTPIGMILATGVLWILTTTLGKSAVAEWGWRIPFAERPSHEGKGSSEGIADRLIAATPHAAILAAHRAACRLYSDRICDHHPLFAARASAVLTGLARGLVVGDRPPRGAVEIVILTAAQRPQETAEPEQTKQQRQRHEVDQDFHHVTSGPARRARRELSMTSSEEPLIAAAAISGVVKPAMATGTASTL